MDWPCCARLVISCLHGLSNLSYVTSRAFAVSFYVIKVVKETPLAQLDRVLVQAGLALGTMPPVAASGVPPLPPPQSPTPSEEVTSVKVEMEHQAVRIMVDGVRKYKCSACGDQFGSKNGCVSHIMRDHSSKFLFCPVCNWTTTNHDSLIRHERTAHN